MFFILTKKFFLIGENTIQKKKSMRQEDKQKNCKNNLVRDTENIFKLKTKRLSITWQKNLR